MMSSGMNGLMTFNIKLDEGIRQLMEINWKLLLLDMELRLQSFERHLAQFGLPQPTQEDLSRVELITCTEPREIGALFHRRLIRHLHYGIGCCQVCPQERLGW